MELADVTDSKSVGSNTVWVRVPPPAPNTEAPVGCLCVWLSRTGLEAGETKRSCGAFCPAGERKQSGRAARSASKGRFERRVPPPAPNTEAPVGCLCVWLSRTGLEAGETKRSCGAFCPAGERKQSGRAARSASKGRFERRVPPPAPWRVFLQHLRSCEDTCFLFIAIFSLLQGGEVDCVECFSRLHLSVAIAIALSFGIEFT